MRVGMARGHAPARRAREKTAVNQVGLDDVFERPLVLAHGGGQGLQPDRPSGKFFDERRQERSVETIEPGLIDIESTQREPGRIESDMRRVAIADRSEVTNAPK